MVLLLDCRIAARVFPHQVSAPLLASSSLLPRWLWAPDVQRSAVVCVNYWEPGLSSYSYPFSSFTL